MTILTGQYNGMPLISPSGEIDMNSSPELRKVLLSLVRRKASPLLVDFSGVTYIDSSGIATFVEGLKGVMSYGGQMKLVAIPEAIMEIFTFSRLDRVFETYRTIHDAFGS